MTFSTFCESPGRVLDALRIGTVIDLTRHDRVIARVTGVSSAEGNVWTVVQCMERAKLRRALREVGRVVVSRDGLVEAVIEGVR